MKQIVFVLSFILVLVGCKKDKDEVKPTVKETPSINDQSLDCDSTSNSFLTFADDITPLYFSTSRAMVNKLGLSKQIFIESSNYADGVNYCPEYQISDYVKSTAVLISYIEDTPLKTSNSLQITTNPKNINPTKAHLKIVLPNEKEVIANSGTITMTNLSYHTDFNDGTLVDLKTALISYSVIGNDGELYSGEIVISKKTQSYLFYFSFLEYTLIDDENVIYVDSEIATIDSLSLVGQGINPFDKLNRYELKLYYQDQNKQTQWINATIVSNRVDGLINGEYTLGESNEFSIEKASFSNDANNFKEGTLTITNMYYSSSSPKISFSFIDDNDRRYNGYFDNPEAVRRANIYYYNNYFQDTYFEKIFALQSIYIRNSGKTQSGLYLNQVLFAPSSMIGFKDEKPYGSGPNILLEMYSSQAGELDEGTYTFELNANKAFIIHTAKVYFSYQWNSSSISDYMQSGELNVKKDSKGKYTIDFDFYQVENEQGVNVFGKINSINYHIEDY